MKYYQVFLDSLYGQEQLLATVWASNCNSACNRVRTEQQLDKKAKLFTIDYDKRNQYDVMAEYPTVLSGEEK